MDVCPLFRARIVCACSSSVRGETSNTLVTNTKSENVMSSDTVNTFSSCKNATACMSLVITSFLECECGVTA